LDELHYVNGLFKVTLFAIPGEMTAELCEWCKANNSWIELAVHGFFHRNNYECEKMTYEEFDSNMNFFQGMIGEYFTKGFKAPGWQISEGIYQWLTEHDWWIADQSYNDMRRPIGLKAYVNNNGVFLAQGNKVDAWHGHTWNCVGNGIYERFDELKEIVRQAQDFKFISEVV
jgi:hypothetical protein